jgi:hypothetical protein
MPDDNTQLVAPDQPTTMTSSDAEVMITATAAAFSERVRLELADDGRAASAFSGPGRVEPTEVEASASVANLNSL